MKKPKKNLKKKRTDIEEKDIKANEEEIKNKNQIKEMNERCKIAIIINNKQNIMKIQENNKERNRILIEVMYCFAINWLNKKLYKKLRNEEIESIIKVTNINVNNENEYIKYIKISHKRKY